MKLVAIKVLALGFSLFCMSCKKDTVVEGLKVQSHNENEMMKIMHVMENKMDTMSMMKNVDHDFAMMMRTHHQGAIDMASNVLTRGDNADIKGMATKMKAAQTSEIAELTEFLQGHMSMDTINYVAYHMEVMSSMKRMSQGADIQVVTGDADYDFATLMVYHHQAAMEMSHALIEHGKSSELKDMARKMIEDQQMEIEHLQGWVLKNKPY